MKNTNNFIAGINSFGITFAIISTVLSILVFSTVLICLWWVDVKKRPLKELWICIKKAIWGFFEKIYEFFNYNSTVKTVYSDKSMNYSGTEFLPIPTKAPTNQYTYEFVGWDKNGVDENGNIVVRAIYLQKVTKCYINVFDDDKTTLLYSAVVEYGAGVNLSDLHPEKPDSKEFSYKFVGWDKDINAFYKNENVYAVYNAIPKKFTYKFVDEDGETVVSQGTAIYGTPIIAPKAPKKDSSTNEVNEFSGWKNYTEGMLLTKDCVFFAEYIKKPLGGVGTSAIIKTEGEKVKVVEEANLSKDENATYEDIKLNRLASAIKFDTGVKNENPVTEIKHSSGTGVIRKKAGMVIEQNQTAKFQAINSSEKQTSSTDDEVHQKIQLMTIKKTADVENSNSKIIKIKPKPEKEPEEDELLKNMMINKIKIDKKEED